MGNQRKIYGAGMINIDESRSNFPLSLHRNLSQKHSCTNMLYQYVKPRALFRYGTMVHWQPRRNVEKETKKRRIGARSNLRTRGKASVYLYNCKEENIDLCGSNSLSTYHLFVIFGVEILLPLKYLCENVYGASKKRPLSRAWKTTECGANIVTHYRGGAEMPRWGGACIVHWCFP